MRAEPDHAPGQPDQSAPKNKTCPRRHSSALLTKQVVPKVLGEVRRPIARLAQLEDFLNVVGQITETFTKHNLNGRALGELGIWTKRDLTFLDGADVAHY